MASYKIKSNGVTLPAPTAVTRSEEKLWSSNTGRSVTDGKMIGDIVAVKRTYSVTWNYLTETEYNSILNNLPNFNGNRFFDSVSIVKSASSGTVTETFVAYTGPVSGSVVGYLNGVLYYNEVTVDIIEQ